MKKIHFLLVLLICFMASISSSSMVGAQKLQLPYCLVNSDCQPVCAPNCVFCVCAGGVCFRGCGGKLTVANNKAILAKNEQPITN
ncbi:hypothetical protein CDL12_19561 [Handroanthus impetiginosus]|uniref:Uncharacterized protein n=1 Tax=Handroanthus impetiginosus TaxID=429701 RepID=A0A2G9GRG7_9LAMI|nr:hypothetical protein CDL12_19561 [Handroanthus impetiginosus]